MSIAITPLSQRPDVFKSTQAMESIDIASGRSESFGQANALAEVDKPLNAVPAMTNSILKGVRKVDADMTSVFKDIHQLSNKEVIQPHDLLRTQRNFIILTLQTSLLDRGSQELRKFIETLMKAQ